MSYGKYILGVLFTVLCAWQTAAQVTHTEFKAKNFPPSQRAEFNKAFKAYNEGEKQYKLLIKENNAGLLPSTLWYFNTAYAFNPNHIQLNRYLSTLMLMQNKTADAFPYLENLYNLKADLSPDEMFILASLLQKKGSYTRAEIIFQRFRDVHGDNNFWSEGRLQNPSKRIEECRIGSALAKSDMRFVSGSGFTREMPPATKELFYNHYYGWWSLASNGNNSLSNSAKKNLNTVWTGGEYAINSDLNGLIFLYSDGADIIQIRGDKKLEVEKLNGEFQNRDPFITNDLRLLYFSSDRPEGFGGFDIWVATFDVDGKLLSVKNAGAAINDEYDQCAPSLSADGKSFFVSSNGKGSAGGFDIMYGKYEQDTVEQIKNIGFPINSGYEEIKIIWDITGTKGFVKQMVNDTVRFIPFRETGSFKEALLIGTGYSSATIGPLSSTRYEAGVSESFINGICKLNIRLNKPENITTTLEIFNLKDGSTFLKQILPDTASVLNYLLPSQYNYGIHINGQNLLPYTATLDLQTHEVFLEKNITAQLSPIKRGNSFVLSNIFFSKDYIDMDARSMYEITRVVEWLKQNPKVKVEIAVHIDALSMHSTVIAAGESAAFQIYEEMKKMGIEKKRLDWMFYGADKPLYTGNDVAESARNRRIELIITDK